LDSRTRRRSSGIGIAVAGALFAAALLVGAVLARASVGPAQQTGTFALLGGTPEIVSKFWAVMGPGLSSTLKVQQYPAGSKSPILNYAVEMQKTMHMVVVRDDFATFAHLHPAFNTTTGTFSQSFTKQPNHRYYVYADSTPVGMSQQVFRFTIESDGPTANDKPTLAASEPAAVAGPYTVTLAKTALTANTPEEIDITIDKGGHPAGDLGSYLGAASHVVFINTSTLQYVHVHPMAGNTTNAKGTIEMNMSGTGPHQHMHLPALPAGTYKTWLQFRGGEYKLYTVPFTIVAR